MGVKCPKCKAENTSDSEFCKECATALYMNEFAFPTKTFQFEMIRRIL